MAKCLFLGNIFSYQECMFHAPTIRLEMYERYTTGESPYNTPTVCIYRVIHYALGGLCKNYNLITLIDSLLTSQAK